MDEPSGEVEVFRRADGYQVSSDPAALQRDMILDFLETSYWAKGRDRDLNWRAIRGSAPYGLFAPDRRQAGFVRVISDYAKFAWIGDVFVLPEHRGLGLGKWMVDLILNHSRFRNIRDWQLSTDDAQGLYRKFGFCVFEGTGKFMTLRRDGKP